jgi:hypothetical protein
MFENCVAASKDDSLRNPWSFICTKDPKRQVAPTPPHCAIVSFDDGILISVTRVLPILKLFSSDTRMSKKTTMILPSINSCLQKLHPYQ